MVRNDRKKKAQEFLEVLAPCVWQEVSTELAKKMSEAHSLRDADNCVTFHKNEEYLFDGTWSTKASEIMRALANDDLGFDLSAMQVKSKQMEELDNLSRRMLLAPDELSQKSFKTAIAENTGGLAANRNKETNGPSAPSVAGATSGSPSHDGDSGGGHA